MHCTFYACVCVCTCAYGVWFPHKGVCVCVEHARTHTFQGTLSQDSWNGRYPFPVCAVYLFLRFPKTKVRRRSLDKPPHAFVYARCRKMCLIRSHNSGTVTRVRDPFCSTPHKKQAIDCVYTTISKVDRKHTHTHRNQIKPSAERQSCCCV